ncbi:MAG: hypothetical protein QOE80_1168 [Actinomycetota bacterium]|jgi:hypothetical protein|nr:hypothetical protein [Actinomycetota bacterium]
MEAIVELFLGSVVDVLIGLIVSYVVTRLGRPHPTSGPLGAAA